MERESWRAAVHGVAKSRTRLSDWTEQIHCLIVLSFIYKYVCIFKWYMYKIIHHSSWNTMTQWMWALYISVSVTFPSRSWAPGSHRASTFLQISMAHAILFFFFNFIFFLNFTILYWFCHISKWICHRHTRVAHPEPSSFLPPHTIPLGRETAFWRPATPQIK